MAGIDLDQRLESSPPTGKLSDLLGPSACDSYSITTSARVRKVIDPPARAILSAPTWN